MRPRQNLHRTTPPSSYHALSHNQNLVQQQPMAPPPLPPSASVNLAMTTAQSSLPTPDLITELIRLGLNPEEMAKQSNRQTRGREDIFKNLQAMLNKKETAELLQKLTPMNEWPTQSVTPPDFPSRVVSGNGSGTCSRDSVVCGPSGIVGNIVGCASGASSLTNHTANNGNSTQQELDIQFVNAQHQASASAVNHNQHFRVPTTNTTTVHNSSQPHKSVLSIHQQQKQHHNEYVNRRLNQPHNSSSSSNPFSNSNDMNRVPLSSSSISTTSPNLNTLDLPNNNLFDCRSSPPVVPYTAASVGAATRAPNLMENLAGNFNGGINITGIGMDDIYNNSAFQQASLTSKESLANQQQSITRHQQLQKLLRVSASTSKNPSTPRIGDPLGAQRNLNNNNNNSHSHIQRQLTSPIASSAISPPQQGLSSVPKSLLNLAACSTSPPSSNSISSLTSGMKSSRNTNSNQLTVPNSGSHGPGTAYSSINRAPLNSAYNSKIPLGIEPCNLLQQMIARNPQVKNVNLGQSVKSSSTNQTLTSLLTDDQKLLRDSSSTTLQNQIGFNQTKLNNQSTAKKQSHDINDFNTTPPQDVKAKETYLAYLQERIAKAGISMGKSQPIPSTLNDNASSENNLLKDNLLDNNDRDGTAKRDSGATLSQVDSRNDLSLMYPPIPLAMNSQKQINSYTTSLELSNYDDIITDELKKIIQDECNIIYECKKCSNLFRSLANLVKHKKSYCNEHNINSEVAEISRRIDMLTSNTLVTKMTRSIDTPVDQESTTIDSLPNDLRKSSKGASIIPSSNQKYNLRGRHLDVRSNTIETKSSRGTRDRRELGDNAPPIIMNQILNKSVPDSNQISLLNQTNLSRLLQSHPRPSSSSVKDSAILEALNMSSTVTPPQSTKQTSVNSGVKFRSINELNDLIGRNSSLAKTLLNEKNKSISPGQSLINQTKTSSSDSIKRPPGPKRKYLEDCIQKVKRDKLSEDSESSGQDLRSVYTNQAIKDTHGASVVDIHMVEDLDQLKDPLAIEESSTDSDALIMDLEEPDPSKRGLAEEKNTSRSRGRIRDNRLNSSSALLKALTRPVENRTPIESGQANSEAGKTKSTINLAAVSQKGSNHDNNPLSSRSSSRLSKIDHVSSKSLENLAKKSVNDNNMEEDITCPPPSPLFDKYTCELCEVDFENQSALLDHTVDTHTGEKKIYPCIFCSFSFITLENVCRHIVDMHKKTKAQVTRLKEVVLSRSFISSDFATCIDHPPITIKVTSPLQSNVNNDTTKKSTSPAKRRNSSALSDTATTKQMLEETIAMVSDDSSPKFSASNSTQRFAEIMSKTSTGFQHQTIGSDSGDKISYDTDDPLGDPIIDQSITEEHLAILEREEAEIEAERLKREQDAAANLTRDVVTDTKRTYSEDIASQSESISDDQRQISEERISDSTDTAFDKDTADTDDTNIEYDLDLTENREESDTLRSKKQVISENISSEARQTDSDAIEFKNLKKIGVHDTETTQHRTTPSRGKHLIANQPFEHEQDSDQDDRYDDEQNLDDANHSADINADPNDEKDRYEHSDVRTNSSSNEGENSSDDSGSELSECSSERDDSSDDLDISADDDDDDDDDDNGNNIDNAHAPERPSKKRFSGSKRISHVASLTKGEIDMESFPTSGMVTPDAEYNDGASSSTESHKASTKSAQNDGKSKARSASREISASGSCNANVSGIGTASAGSSSGGGGIMKLKIQLKTQPDEKSKVYRIVD